MGRDDAMTTSADGKRPNCRGFRDEVAGEGEGEGEGDGDGDGEDDSMMPTIP